MDSDGEMFTVRHVRESSEYHSVYGVRFPEGQHLGFYPHTDVQRGNWLTRGPTAIEYHVTDVDFEAAEKKAYMLKASYETVGQYETRNTSTERYPASRVRPPGSRDERRRFLGAIYAIANGNPTQHVSWVDAVPWMGWDRDDQDSFEHAVDIAEYLQRSGFITIESEVGSVYLITDDGMAEVANDPALAEPPDVFTTPDEFSDASPVGQPPVEIQDSLNRFRAKHSDPSKVAFIMMQFGRTRAHDEITKAVREGLAAHGIEGVRADGKRYHDNLFYNVLTYMHGCGLGMAIYERIETQVPNPNVSLEAGYMFAMRKPVCLLKDRTLDTLPADLVGQLYDPFDPQDAAGTIPPLVSRWLSDKNLA